MGSVLVPWFLVVAGGVSLVAWARVLLDPARPWDLEPVGEDDTAPPPDRWPSVCAVVPARNEAAFIPHTLPALLAQDYPGPFRTVLVDDRSTDGTAAVAGALADGRLTVVAGKPLPAGWTGKVWALDQGLAVAGAPDYLLLTDADIRHTPGSLRALVADGESNRLELTSRMALLHCQSVAERLVIPPFLFFFNLLYPMRRVNDPSSTVAAAAGGCILLRRLALEQADGFESIRGNIIDDVSLARLIKSAGGRIRLAVSRRDVASLRSHSFGSAWKMVSRTAFDELRYSWLRLAAALAGLVLLFAVPPSLVVLAAIGGGAGTGWRVAIGVLGGGAWAISAAVYGRTVRFFGLNPLWALALPVGGLVYGGMTLDSAARHLGRVLRHGDTHDRW